MLRFLRYHRAYCKLASKGELPKAFDNNGKTCKIDFQCLKHPSKVPNEPVTEQTGSAKGNTEIDSKTIQLLERLSLVDLNSKAALEALKSSIEFADKIGSINTENVSPLYSVLEHENLQLRDDRVIEGNCREDILKNARVTDEDYFVSPPGNIPLEQEEKKLEDL